MRDTSWDELDTKARAQLIGYDQVRSYEDVEGSIEDKKFMAKVMSVGKVKKRL